MRMSLECAREFARRNPQVDYNLLITNNCASCGKSFETKLWSGLLAPKFCSRECLDAMMATRGFENFTASDVTRHNLKHQIADPPKRAKYRNKIAYADGIKFHSEKERDYWLVLKNRELHDEISELERQVEYALVVHGVLIARYFADFRYVEKGTRHVVDTKGFRTKEFEIKRKLMKACYGIDVECV